MKYLLFLITLFIAISCKNESESTNDSNSDMNNNIKLLNDKKRQKDSLEAEVLSLKHTRDSINLVHKELIFSGLLKDFFGEIHFEKVLISDSWGKDVSKIMKFYNIKSDTIDFDDLLSNSSNAFGNFFTFDTNYLSNSEQKVLLHFSASNLTKLKTKLIEFGIEPREVNLNKKKVLVFDELKTFTPFLISESVSNVKKRISAKSEMITLAKVFFNTEDISIDSSSTKKLFQNNQTFYYKISPENDFVSGLEFSTQNKNELKKFLSTGKITFEEKASRLFLKFNLTNNNHFNLIFN